jgi:hypothetical protein
VTVYYPEIPPEGDYSESEQAFIENSPPGLWPDNQDSYFGQFRKVTTDEFQDIRDILFRLWLNMVPQTADEYLYQWEIMVDLPPNPNGRTVRQRRVDVLARLQRGAFTRPKRDKIINDYVSLTVDGDPARFTPDGISFEGGIPLFAEYAANIETKFTVYEFVQDYYYRVVVATGYLDDPDGLERQLKRITPAGIRFEMDTWRVLPYSYYYEMLHLEPSALWSLRETSGTAASDVMKNQTPGVYNGPTLDNRMLNVTDGDKNPLFDGTNDRVGIAYTPALYIAPIDFTIVALIYPTSVTGLRTIYSNSFQGVQFMVWEGDLRLDAGNAFNVGYSIPAVAINQIQLVGVSKRPGEAPVFWHNGVRVANQYYAEYTFLNGASGMIGSYFDGATYNFAGNIGYVGIYKKILTDQQWHRLNAVRLGLVP